MREKEIEKKLVAGVRLLGGTAYKFVSPGRDGVPDRILVMPGGEIWFVELKADEGELSPRQRYQVDYLNSMGCRVYVCKGKAGVEGFLRYLRDEVKG